MADDRSSSLRSTQKSSDSLDVHLHPLVLLTISDYITRHVLRRQQGPIVGALLGQQNGREISLEHAFECNVLPAPGGAVILNESWFKDRLQQFKDVHKAPALELVGWFTTAPATGPELDHLSIHQQILKDYNESAILLAFHPSGVLKRDAVSGKLPLTIYESVYESRKAEGQGAGDNIMDIVGGDPLHAPQLDLRFRELAYSVETGEAEMISVDFVARGGATSTAVDAPGRNNSQAPTSTAPTSEVNLNLTLTGKQKIADVPILTPEDEELITSLTARANAIKMLHARIHLLKSYLNNLPPSYLTGQPPSDSPDAAPTSPTHTEINHPILRSIQALISRLPLLLPDDHAAFNQERLAEKTDVSLITLLGDISKSLKDTREMGRKFAIIDQSRQSNKKGGGVFATNDDFFAPMAGGGSEGGGTLAPYLL